MQWQPSTEPIGEPVKSDPLLDEHAGPLVSYRRQWLLVVLFGVCALYYRVNNPGISFQPAPAQPVSALEIGNWFFILRLPEAPVEASAQELYKDRIHNWLFALHEARFQPIGLSDALGRLNQGKSLPARSVVLVADPGMRRTYDCLDPILTRGRWPAVWLTPQDVLKHPDTTYLSPHQLGGMKSSGPWEIAFYQHAKETFFVDPDAANTDGPPWKGLLAWNTAGGRQALNRGNPTGTLNRLNLNLAWTPAVLVDTLLSEMPTRKAAQLIVKPSFHRLLGMAEEIPELAVPSPFHLEAPPDSRHAVVSWLGTRGVHNMSLEMYVEDWIGEVWVLMRADAERGENVRVGIREGSIELEFDQFPSKTRLARWAAPSLQRGPLHATMTLVDEHLTLRVNGRDFPAVTLPAKTVSSEGIVQLYIQDRVQGAAQALVDNLTLHVLDP